MRLPTDEAERPVMNSAPSARVIFDGREYLYFGGTGYLGLQADPRVIEAGCRAARQQGVASATSRARLGNNAATLAVEREAAAFFATQAAFYLPSGYLGPRVLLDALADSWDAIIVDESAHYAVREAADRSGRPVSCFGHLSPDDLTTVLASLPANHRVLVMTDAVFAARGELAPLPELMHCLSNRPGSAVLIDDAHGVGVLGEYGRGTVEHFDLADTSTNTTDEAALQLLWTGTLSKAFGGAGGIVVGTESFIDRLKRGSHLYDGASQPSVFDAAASAEGLRIARSEPVIRQRLHANTRYLRQGLAGLGLNVPNLPTPIVAFALDSDADMRRVHRELWDAGICLPYLQRYAGIEGRGLLRATVMAVHATEQLDRLVDQLARRL